MNTRAKILSLAALVVSGALGASSALARDLPNPPTESPSWTGWSAELTLAAHLNGISQEDYASHQQEYQLADGTVIEGLYFAAPEPGVTPKLLIASFGLFQSRWDAGAGAFLKDSIQSGELNDVDVLILDSATSGTFYAKNGAQFSPGSYDEGEVLLEVAELMKARHSGGKLSVRLLGYSRSGVAALHAAAEDQRQGLRAVDGVLTFSAAVDELDTSRDIMIGLFKAPLALSGTRDVYELPLYAQLGLDLAWKGFENASRGEEGPSLDDSGAAIGTEMLKGSNLRLSMLRAHRGAASNPKVDLGSIEGYIISTNAALDDDLGKTTIPIFMVHAKNDPIIPFGDFSNLASRYQASSNIQTLATAYGSHCGFSAAYGGEFTQNLIRRVLDF